MLAFHDTTHGLEPMRPERSIIALVLMTAMLCMAAPACGPSLMCAQAPAAPYTRPRAPSKDEPPATPVVAVQPTSLPATPPPRDAFPDLSKLVKTPRLIISDSWSGLGWTYSLVAQLYRESDKFIVVAALRTQNGMSSRSVNVSTRQVDALLEEIASRGEAPPPAPVLPGAVQVSWTDDYPVVDVLVFDREDSAPARVFYSEQHRKWHVSRGETDFVLAEKDGEVAEARARAEKNGGSVLPQPRVHAAYAKVLKEIGLQDWISAEYNALSKKANEGRSR